MDTPRALQPCSSRGFTAAWRAALPLLAVLVWELPAQSCPAPSTIAADRPGNLTMPLVLPVGHQQLEVGVSDARSGGTHSRAVGLTLVRVGILCGVELRLASGGWQSSAQGGASIGGFADGWVGTKVRLLGGSGFRPHLAVLAGVLLPTHTASSHQRSEPDVNLSAMWDLPHGQTAAVFSGVADRWNGGGFVAERLSGASWAFPVGALASFVEYSEYVRPGVSSRFVATGLQFFPRATVQVDASVTLPVPRAGSDVAFGFGLSTRW